MRNMAEISEAIFVKGTERLNAAAEIDPLQISAEAVEQSEMNAFEQAATPEAGEIEQQEMDRF